MALLYTTGQMKNASPTFSTGGEATGFPVQNCFDFNPDTYYKPSATGQVTIDIDFGETVTIDQFAVWIHNYNHDYESGSQAIGIATDDNDDGNYTATTVFGSELWDNTVGTPIYFPYSSPTSATKRYWRFQVANMTEIAEISQLFFLRKRTLSTDYQYPTSHVDVYESREIFADGGRRFVYGINSNVRKEWKREYQITNGTDWDSQPLKQAFDDCAGTRYPLIYSDADGSTYCRFANQRIDSNEQDYRFYKPTVTYVTIPYIPDGESY